MLGDGWIGLVGSQTICTARAPLSGAKKPLKPLIPLKPCSNWILAFYKLELGLGGEPPIHPASSHEAGQEGSQLRLRAPLPARASHVLYFCTMYTTERRSVLGYILLGREIS